MLTTALDGAPWQFGVTQLVVSNGRLHAELIRRLAGP